MPDELIDDSLLVKGDYKKVPVQIGPGGTGGVARPTKSTHLIWGGSDPSSPWAHLMGLIQKAGGEISYLHIEADEVAKAVFAPTGAPGDAPVTGSDSQTPPPDPDEETVQQVAPTPHPAAPGEGHVSGGPGKGPLFEGGIDVGYQGEPTRIWAHRRAANSGPRPLIIYLHGINSQGRLHPALSEDVGKRVGGWMHMGKLAQKLIDDAKVTPLAIAAPTHSASAPWDKLDFEELVNLVETKLKESGVEIDLDQITIVGHSGAGGYPGRGMDKLAEEGGMIGSHKVKVFGLADTRITSAAGANYKTGLSKNDTTAIYALHRGTGGWDAGEYNSAGGSSGFAKALGATNQNKKQVVGEENLDSVEEYWDNESTKPPRVSIKAKAAMGEFLSTWRACGAYGPVEMTSHENAVARWTAWALPRFHAQTEHDGKLMTLASSEPPPPEAPAIEEAGPPPTAPVITGGAFNIPPAAAPWTNPDGDIPPKQIEKFEFASPTGLYYPVRAEKLPAGRGVYYIGTDNLIYGPQGKGSTKAGHFWANRMSGKRKHIGVDLSINAFNATVVACENGKIVNWYEYYEGAWCLIVQCADKTINYGEIDKDSLTDFKLKVGDPVVAGQPIGHIRKMKVSAMCHFEIYAKGQTQSFNYFTSPKSKKEIDRTNGALKYLRNPTNYLLGIAKSGR